MGRLSTSGSFECEVGGVYHIAYFTPPEIEDIISQIGKDKTVPTSGRIFPYISHYLTTGDLIYPAHEGEGPMSELLQEMGRLNLVHHLFPNQSGAKANTSGVMRPPPCKQPSCVLKDDTSTKLRIKTKKERWPGFSKAFARFLHPSSDQKTHRVYRPPQQIKGTTLVVVKTSRHGNSDLKVHGPTNVLESLLADALSITTQPTHHHINGYATLSIPSASTVVDNLEDQGFVVTVRSSLVEGLTGALITQWLMYRRGSNKKMSTAGTAPRKSSSLGKNLNSTKRHRRISTSAPRKKSLKISNNTKRKSLFNVDAGKEKLDSSSLSSDGSTNRSAATTPDQDLNSKKSLEEHVTCNSPSTSTVSTNSSMNSGSNSSASPKETKNVNFSSHQNSSPKILTIKETREGIKRTSSFNQLDFVRKSENKKSIYESKFLTLGHKSISVSSILTPSEPIKTPKPKSSPSLWNICSKSSVKKVFRVIF